MPVNVKKITEERLTAWSKQLVDVHATPILLVGVGHDHVSGQIRVVTIEDFTVPELIALLKKTIKQLEK